MIFKKDSTSFILTYMLQSFFFYLPRTVASAHSSFTGNDEVCLISFNSFKGNTCSTNFTFFFKFIKNSSIFRLRSCIDLSAIDKLIFFSRFRVFYDFSSVILNRRLTVFFNINQSDSVHSLNQIFPSTNWLERECFDMFGIYFINHKSMSRILTDYGFLGYPLKKDFPTSGLYQIYFSPYLGRIKYSRLIS